MFCAVSFWTHCNAPKILGSDVNQEMDVGLHGWVSTRYSRSYTKGTLFTRGLLYFKSTFNSFFFGDNDNALL